MLNLYFFFWLLPVPFPCIKQLVMKDPISIRASDARHQPRRGIHQHKHHEILIIKAGAGSHVVDFERFDIKPNQIYFLRPGQVHEFSPNPGAEFYFIAFDNVFLW